MSGRSPGTIVAMTVHARRVPAPERQQFAGRIRALPAGDAVVIETCHRVEAYFNSPADPVELGRQVELPDGGSTLIDEAAVRHAIAVAVGRDSVIVGEDQILHQVREAVDHARRDERLDPELERLFGHALQAGRRARSWRQGQPRSLADVAVSAIEGRIGPLAGRGLLVVGAGRMGRLAARAGASAGASVAIANRTREGATALAAMTGAATTGFDPGRDLAGFAGVIVALAGPWRLGPAGRAALQEGSAIVVDLSVPVAVEAHAGQALGTRLISADMLALTLAEADPMAADVGLLNRLDALVDEATREYIAWLDGHQGRATAEALMEQADRERQAELERLWRNLPDLEPEARAAIEGMTRHLARRLLREPLERLGRDHDGRDEQAVRDLFAL